MTRNKANRFDDLRGNNPNQTTEPDWDWRRAEIRFGRWFGGGCSGVSDARIATTTASEIGSPTRGEWALEGVYWSLAVS